MKKSLWYVLPAALLFVVGTAGAQPGTGKAGSASKEDRADEQKSPSGSPGRSESRQSAGAKSGATITTAQGVASAKDDQPVKLRGKIVGQQGRNDYMLSDSSGKVLVEIPSRALNGKKLATGSEVEVMGEVDTRRNKQPKVNAKSVNILAASGGMSGSSSGSARSAPSGAGK